MEETAVKPIRIAGCAIFALSLLSGAAFADTAPRGWYAYVAQKNDTMIVDDNGKSLKDPEWLKMGFSDYQGFKPRLAVVYAQEKQQQSAQYSNEWVRMFMDMGNRGGAKQAGTNPFNHVEDIVNQALLDTHRFRMLERTNALEDVTGEQDFGASGRVDKTTAAQTGKMKGADFIVKPTIIEWLPEKDSRDIGLAAGALGAHTLGFGSVGISGKVAYCKIAVKIVDATTGEIVEQSMCEGTAKSTGLSLGGGALGGLGGKAIGGALGSMTQKKGAPMSDAMTAAVNKCAFWVARKLAESPWSGTVLQVTAKGVMIKGGSNIGLMKGMTLKLLSKGEAVADPDDPTAPPFFPVEEIGTIRITSVQDRFSMAEIVTGGKGGKAGDVVRLEPATR
jgi:curli biogenesis system outer membrane secretion channel CsgG